MWEHSLKVVATGETRTIQGWGFHRAVHATRCDGTDDLTLSIAAGPAEAPLFAVGAKVQLLDWDGIIRWAGTMSRPRRVAKGGQRLQVYRGEGLSRQLREKMFRQIWRLASVNETTGAVTASETALTQVNLFVDLAGAAVSLKNQIKAILDYAITLGIDLTYDLDNLPDVQPQVQEEVDLRLHDAILAVLAWCPEVSMRVTYAGGTAHVDFARFDALDDGTLHMTGGATRTADLHLLEDFECDPREDLLVGTMRISYLRPVMVTLPNGAKRVPLNVTQDTSVADNDSEVEMESTVRLDDLQWNGGGFTPPDDAPAAGLAKSLHQGFAKLAYELRFSRPVHKIDWAPSPGELWVVENAGEDLEGAYSVCQEITRDLKGRISFKIGVGTLLSLSGRLQLLRANRKRKSGGSSAGEQQYGFSKDDKNADAGTSLIVKAGIAGDRVKVKLPGATVVP